MSITVDSSRLSLVREESTYLAIRTSQGGRTVYTTRIPLADLSVILTIPDPAKPDPDNRKVDINHAKGFGQYLTDNPRWVAPALLIRDTGGCRFEAISEDESVGYLTVPWSIGGIGRLVTIDGQHRILGVHLEKKRITDEVSRIDREMHRAKDAKKAKLERDREAMVGRMQRLKDEFVGIDIYVEPDGVSGQQMFVDVADNAKGISGAVRARFDTSRIANRTISDIVSHPLFLGKIDIERDRMTLSNRNLMGAKHVADITRAVIAGPGGRVSKKAESLTDNEVIESVRGFLDVVSIAFAALAEITEEDVDNYDPALSEKKKGEPQAPPTKAMRLRESSLLGSVGMLRVLGGVYRNLREEGVEDGDIQEFFKRLDRHMIVPVTETSIWRTTAANEDFEPNASAPIMRQQNVVHLTRVITDWHKKAPAEV
ncbi:DNA sulfur modification protein DndB [Nocardiopsis prasina]|uniref:DNA sulfur modification protein DndB n=1 Tax=Nocardiopsis prasina TaxID=2015 RepID=UPI0003461AA4|nr:DNA sulfur modification protein DndB [Nocardiopsis prasina]